MGYMLRSACCDIRRVERTATLGESVDAHTGLEPGRTQIPLSVVAAARNRLVRQFSLLRLPGSLSHTYAGTVVGCHKPGFVHWRSQSHPRFWWSGAGQPGTVLRRTHFSNRAVANA